MKFIAKHFSELSPAELYEILRARAEIFLLEQHIVIQDMDRIDYDCLHCFLWEDGPKSSFSLWELRLSATLRRRASSFF